MNQHFFGVMLFCLIVGTAIFASAYFTPLPSPLPVYEKSPVVIKNKEYSCSKQSRTVTYNPGTFGQAQVKVIQAVLNPETSQLNTDFLIKRENPNTDSVSIALHFFVKDGRSTQYLATEMVSVKPDFDQNGKAGHDIISSFKWLDDLERRDNLYIIAESTLNFNRSKNLEPVFNAANATPVLRR